MSSVSPVVDTDADNPHTSISLIVAVDEITAGAIRSLEAMSSALADANGEIIVASREPWRDAPDWVTVVPYNSASRGDRFDRAAEFATGDLLAFTDTRVRLPAGWAQTAIDVFAEHPHVGVIGGPVLPRSPWRGERVSAVITDRYSGMSRAGHMSRLQRVHTVRELTGSNLVIPRKLFWSVGGFQSPSVGGEAARLCYKVRSLRSRTVLYHPRLAATATVRRFPGPFLSDVSTYGRARGDLARRYPAMAPLVPHALPTVLALVAAAELALLPFHRGFGALAGLALLGSAYLLAAVRVLLGKGRFGDRLLAAAALPLVALTNGLAFLRGYLGPSMGEISPPRARERPLRVLIINWRDVTHPWAGGAESYMHEIGRRWAAQGIDVGWLCQRHSGSRRVEMIDGIRFHRGGGRLTLYPMVAIMYVLRLRGRYDVIIDCENGIPFFTPLFSRVPKVLVVHHVHREIFRRETKPPMRWLGLWLEGWLMPRAYRNAQVVAVSASTRDDLVALGFRADQIAIVHNGVHPAPRVLSPPAQTPTILCMGRLTPQKSVDVLIRALPNVLRVFPNARLDIVGQGPDRRRLEILAWSLNLANHVRFHGYLPGPIRDELAARAWVAVCPSVFEGWGVTCLESSARGLPVIASNVNGLRDSVRDGETGLLVTHGDSVGLASAITELLGDPERRREMGEAGRRWASLHSWERSADELRAVIASTGIADVQRLDLWPARSTMVVDQEQFKALDVG